MLWVWPWPAFFQVFKSRVCDVQSQMFNSPIVFKSPKVNMSLLFVGASDAVSEYSPLSLMKRQAEDLPATVHTASSETPLGRRGRLANLAATIGSWEDDLSHAHIPSEKAKDKPSNSVPKASVGVSSSAGSKTTSNLNQVLHVCMHEHNTVIQYRLFIM